MTAGPEISTIGVLRELTSSEPDRLNGTVWTSIDKITKYSKVVQRLLGYCDPKRDYFLLSDRKFHENGLAEPTRLRTVLLVSQNMENYGYVVRFHPIRHRPYFMLYAVTLNKETLKPALDSKYQITAPTWWPRDAQNISIFSSNIALNLHVNQATSRIFEFPHDADFESLIRLGGYEL